MSEKKKMSWDGKVHDNPKPFDRATVGSDPVTREDLAEVERNILRMLEELQDQITTPGRNNGGA